MQPSQLDAPIVTTMGGYLLGRVAGDKGLGTPGEGEHTNKGKRSILWWIEKCVDRCSPTEKCWKVSVQLIKTYVLKDLFLTLMIDALVNEYIGTNIIKAQGKNTFWYTGKNESVIISVLF